MYVVAVRFDLAFPKCLWVLPRVIGTLSNSGPEVRAGTSRTLLRNLPTIAETLLRNEETPTHLPCVEVSFNGE